jgi:hypothetical protein
MDGNCEGRSTMFVVIENTPSYLADDAEPATFEDYSSAVDYMNERAAEYENDPDGNYRVEVGWASPNNYAAVMVYDDDKTHDLGRYIGVELCEED